MVPKPSAKYCQVCKERFEDYLKVPLNPISTPHILSISRKLEKLVLTLT